MINGIIWIFKSIKNIILFFIKQIFIFSFRLFLFFLFLFAVTLFVQRYNTEEKIRHRAGDYSYIEFDMGKKFIENGENFLDTVMGENRDYLKFLKKLREIEKDDKIKGLIFKLDNFALNSVQSEEIGKLLKSMGDKKEIYSYSTGFDRGNYLFASYTQKIIMPPTDSATSILIPYSSEIPYYKGLADKVGVKFSVVNTGNYKSMGENLISSSMSQYTRENNSIILDESYNNFLATVSENRKIEKDTLQKKMEDGDYVLVNPKTLKEENLIDEESFYHNFRAKLGEEAVISLEEYQKNREDQSEDSEKIGVIFLHGDIRENFLERGEVGISPELAENLFKNAMEDDEIKGIILRIDSPGGSALASEIIHNMITSYEKKKPVYVSMGRVAASGGYYIATAGDKIYLSKNTLTGSIGVVSVIPNVKELTQKAGVNIERIEKGKNANIYSLFEPLDNLRTETILKSSQRVYLEFKDRVSKSRNLTLEEVEAVAAGRVWLGEKAVEKKLADGVASLEEVGAILGADLKLENYQLVKISHEDMKGEFLSVLKKMRGFSLLKNSFQEMKSMNFFKLSEKIQSEIEENQFLYKPLYYYPEKIKN